MEAIFLGRLLVAPRKQAVNGARPRPSGLDDLARADELQRPASGQPLKLLPIDRRGNFRLRPARSPSVLHHWLAFPLRSVPASPADACPITARLAFPHRLQANAAIPIDASPILAFALHAFAATPSRTSPRLSATLRCGRSCACLSSAVRRVPRLCGRSNPMPPQPGRAAPLRPLRAEPRPTWPSRAAPCHCGLSNPRLPAPLPAKPPRAFALQTGPLRPLLAW